MEDPSTEATGSQSALEAVFAKLLELDPSGDRVSTVLRDTFDQIYDGQHTGRWRFEQLHKTEKTHMGTLVEINLHREFDFDDGDVTDYRIAGIEVDCKYSMRDGGWTLPPEVIDQLALLVTADDSKSTWRAGLVLVQEELLNPGRNRDAKGTLSKLGRDSIRWLWPNHGRLPANIFLSLDTPTLESIFSGTSGQARTNALFRAVQGRIIRRAELATVAQQDDFMKRARANGGSRQRLQQEGILILGHQPFNRAVARGLGLPIPSKGELVSARVAAADTVGPGTVEIDGSLWRLATAEDPVAPAPTVPVR